MRRNLNRNQMLVRNKKCGLKSMIFFLPVEMLFLLFLLFGCAAYAAHPNTTIKVIQTYDRASNGGWITIDLHRLGQITRVEWCKSTIPNTWRRNVRDINECQGPGLMHMQLYPGNKIKILDDEPGVVYIDPDDIGGADSVHQFDILVHVQINATTKLVQVMRFNVPEGPPAAAPPVDTHPAVLPTPAAPASAKPNPPSVGIAEPAQPAPQSPAPQSHHPYLAGLLIVLLGGFAILAISGTLKLRQRKTQVTSYLKSKGFFLDGQSDIEFESVLIDRGSSLDNEDIMESEDTHMARLVKMGVSPAFHNNL